MVVCVYLYCESMYAFLSFAYFRAVRNNIYVNIYTHETNDIALNARITRAFTRVL